MADPAQSLLRIPLARAGRRRKTSVLRSLQPLFWIAPAFLVVFVFTHLPLLLEAVLSLVSANGIDQPSFIGLANYREIFGDADFWSALTNNLIYAVTTVAGKIALALLLAIALNRAIPGRGYFRTVLFLPVVLSFVAIGVIWSFMLSFNYGILNLTLSMLGLDWLKHDWLGSADTALGSVIFVDIWKWFGFHMVIYLAGLQSIPKDLYEAAALDGAGAFSRFWRLTLPLLRPFTGINIMLATLGAFNVFDLIYVMTQGGPFKATNVAMVEIYLQAFQFNRFGYSAAMSVVLLLLVGILSASLLSILNRGRTPQ